MTDGAHVEVGPCLLVDGCDWSGMHWHWGGRRFRSLRDLMDSERLAFGRVLREDQTTAPAGRRQPPERSTMPAMPPTDFRSESPHGPMDPKATTEEEANERAQLTEAMQWLGLLHVDVEHLVVRTGERPLGATIEDLVSIETSAEHLERIAEGLRILRMDLRDVAGQHLDTHDRTRDERRQKTQAAAWATYWHGTRRRERILVTVAHRLPRKLKERVYIAVAVEAISKMPGDTVVPEVRMMDVLEVYSNGRRR